MSGRAAVVLVAGTSHALRARSLLGKAGIAAKLIPVPRHLSSDCGVCVKIDAQQVSQAAALLQKAKVTVEEIHLL